MSGGYGDAGTCKQGETLSAFLPIAFTSVDWGFKPLVSVDE